MIDIIAADVVRRCRGFELPAAALEVLPHTLVRGVRLAT